MIIREWRGRASHARAEAYPKHFRDKVVPELRLVAGFVGAHLGQNRLDDKVEFLVLTRWKSLESVRAFAGEKIDRAIVDPVAAATLIEFDTFARHYEVVEEASLETRGGR